MKILVVNAGSSSLKYQLIDMDTEDVLARGVCERIGEAGSRIIHKLPDGRKYTEEVELPDHTAAFKKVTDVMLHGDYAVLKDLSDIAAVGHRIVQGAERFSESVLVTEEVVNTISEIAPLAPLHNVAHVQAIRACQAVLDKSVPQVVVFDTSFHATMPPKAFLFGVPYEYYKKYHVRRYGFHGTSHRYVSAKCAEVMGRDIKDLKLITCHLGNGCSITAVDGGKSVDTSMGFTPLDGFIMGTRSGGVDPSAVTYIMEKEGFSPKEMDLVLNKKSGYYGLSGGISDHRDLCAAADKGDEKAELARQMQVYQIKKFIGGYATVLGRVDGIVFTGGIGENSHWIRENICENMGILGISIDKEKNRHISGSECEITGADSKVAVWVIATDEELTIARDTKEICERAGLL